MKPAYSGDSDPGGMKVDMPAGKGTCDGVTTTAKHRPESIVAKPRDALSSERRACDRLGAIPEQSKTRGDSPTLPADTSGRRPKMDEAGMTRTNRARTEVKPAISGRRTGGV